jgi:ribonuclease-3
MESRTDGEDVGSGAGGSKEPAEQAELVPAESQALATLEAALGHQFADRSLLATALTHRSGAQERRDGGRHYERLEFLGDAVLGLLAAEWLYQRLEAPEGELSKRKSYLVSEPILAEHAQRLDLGPLLRIGVGEDRSGGREKASLLADSLEALIGAAYLDGGLAAARALVLPLLEAGTESFRRVANLRDPKTTLQERLQERAGGEPPEYRLVGTSGPDHQKRFEVECWAAGRMLGRGEGTSKKRAEQAAAAAALATLPEE